MRPIGGPLKIGGPKLQLCQPSGKTGPDLILPINHYILTTAMILNSFIYFSVYLQADLEDSYRNLTLKAIGALWWISRYCNRTRFVLKTDDDAFVNMRALLKHLGRGYVIW